MRTLFVAIICTAISLLLIQCQKELGNSYSNRQIWENSLPVYGFVVDESGAPAAGVKITAGNKIAATDESGFFKISGAVTDNNTSMVVAEKVGYFKSYRSFRRSRGGNYVSIKLVKRPLAGIIPATGGTVNLANGSAVTLPGNATVSENGSPYNGEVRVFAAYIDPTNADFAQTVPGSLMARNGSDNRLTLVSFGMMAVELESPTGEKLQIATGQTATLTTAIPSSLLAKAPAELPMWYIDEKNGIWTKEESATRQGNKYVAQVKHFSFWNCDIPFPAIKLSLKVVDPNKHPLASVRIKLEAAVEGQQSEAFGFTNGAGEVDGMVPASEPIILKIMDECNNVLEEKHVGPFNEDADLGTLTLTAALENLAIVQGKLLDCKASAVEYGYVRVLIDGRPIVADVTGAGDFVAAIVRCSNATTEVELKAVDEHNLQSSTTRLPMVGNRLNIGTMSACGTLEEYVQYKIAGSVVTITENIFYYNVSNRIPAWPLYSSVWAGHSDRTRGIRFEYGHGGSIGTYPLEVLAVGRDSAGATLSKPFDIRITKYPANVGDFLEGSFSGKFKKTLASREELIECTFRLRRK